MVPKDKVARLRMKLAEGGLPKGGGVGYEIFDKSDALGATSFIQNINHLRALEGELARTIRGIDRVQAARVHLVLPERPLFSRDKAEPSASIVLKVRGTLEPQQVRAIRHLVATAVNGTEARARVGDRRDRQAARRRRRRRTIRAAAPAPTSARSAYENRLREQVEAIVSSVVGPGRARVQLTADFDFNRITQTSDKFDPDGRVVRSSQTREEQSATGDGKERPGLGRQRTARRQQAGGRSGGAARPEPQDRGNRQLRDFAHHQDRGDRGRPGQPHFGRRAGRRQLQQERQGRDRSISRARRKRSTASPRWCARRSASTPSAATRSRWSTCASPKPRRCRSTSRPAG